MLWLLVGFLAVLLLTAIMAARQQTDKLERVTLQRDDLLREILAVRESGVRSDSLFSDSQDSLHHAQAMADACRAVLPAPIGWETHLGVEMARVGDRVVVERAPGVIIHQGQWSDRTNAEEWLRGGAK